MKRIVRFLMVGAVGFAVDAGMLALLMDYGLGPFEARVIAIACAVCVTWSINRSFTFAPSGRSLVAEGGHYGGVGILSSLVNYTVYSLLVFSLPTLPVFWALCAGSGVATALSYFGYSRWVFRR